jgi:hypothetical protein
MRDLGTERLLKEVRRAVVDARAGGVTISACLFDAAVAAVDETTQGWPSANARKAAVAASRVMDPSVIGAAPTPTRKPPSAARLLWSLANRIAARAASKMV